MNIWVPKKKQKATFSPPPFLFIFPFMFLLDMLRLEYRRLGPPLLSLADICRLGILAAVPVIQEMEACESIGERGGFKVDGGEKLFLSLGF